jgi:hypothetical protein
MQYSQADSGCMLSGVRSIHPEIVGWSTAPRGQVINESLGQVLKKLVSRPARAGKDRIITDPIGYETGWTIARSLGGVGTTSVHSNPVFACNDCTFLDELHRATLEKKSSSARRRSCLPRRSADFRIYEHGDDAAIRDQFALQVQSFGAHG